MSAPTEVTKAATIKITSNNLNLNPRLNIIYPTTIAIKVTKENASLSIEFIIIKEKHVRGINVL